MKIRPRILLASAVLLAITTACGGKSGTISLKAVTSPSDDPFGDAATVRVVVGSNVMTMSTAVMAGHFTLSVPSTPGNGTTIITIEALDTAGNVIAWGQTPQVLTSPVDQGPYGVWVARPGTVRPAATSFTVARSEMAATNITGLGALFAGGREPGASAVTNASVYDVYTSTIIDVANMNQARAGAVLTPSSTIQAIAFGGVEQQGLGMSGTAINNAELFDPSSGNGLWAAVMNAANQTIQPAGYSMSAQVGLALTVAGGLADNKKVKGSTIVVTGSTPLVTQGGDMLAARAFGGMAPAMFPEGAGAIVFGGLDPGSTAPVAERVVGTAFMDYSQGFAGIDNRTDLVAIALSDGRVLFAGGRDSSGAVRSDGFVVNPTVPATVTMLPNLLSSPREKAGITNVGADVLICDGADSTGALPASCDYIDGMTLMRTAVVQTGMGRKNPNLVTLETGPVVIAGGLGMDNMPTAGVELFTPAEPAL